MKRLLTAGLVLLAMAGATASFAQQKRTYDDDIYSDTKAAKQAQQEEDYKAQAAPSENDATKPAADDNTYTSSDGDSYDSRSKSREYGDDPDYDNDYYYASRINRFYYPFYNRPYYSSFYNPYWYDPYWVDPYWGWSPWYRPGFSISFGTGPYWSSYWGWSSWYGCGSFGSYYGYPGYGMYGGYYSGYWNGYYAGLYNNYGYGRGYRTITYGPRYSLNSNQNNYTHYVNRSMRRDAIDRSAQATPGFGTPRSSGFRSIDNDGRRAVRENATVNDNGQLRGAEAPSRDRGEIRFSERDRTHVEAAPRADRNDLRQDQSGSAPQESRRGGWFGRSERTESRAPETRRDGGWFGRGERSEAPMREQRSFSQPRMESAPSRNFGGGNRDFGGGSRSFGGGSSGGGRSFGGGRR